MDLLITLIGNAAVDPGFRELFLDNPLRTADEYGFRLTKGDFQIMTAMFTRMDDDERARVEAAFKALEDILYAKMDSSALSAPPPKRPPCTRPCSMSIYPPPGLPELREIIDKQAA
jgi:hypothetical protein